MDEHSIFVEALECESEDARSEFLRGACGADSALRERVLRLLTLHEGASDFLEKPVLAAPAGAVTEGPGTKIGGYKLLEQIGEGGMGVVYMAAQQEPVRRKVALKIIKPGMDSKQVIARFEAERQALAMMEHENIARVLDAGTTESGRPYFVMELVRGVPVTDYCQHARLGPQRRLQLFVDVCHAVQHAHQKGIIHRDIKPSNVMVTLHDGEPVVKMIDFGVAKATNQQLTDRTLFTNYAQMIGTPLYMSPEQAEMSGLDVDTRSDIYSLGVLLYELLTGTTPFEKQRLKEAGYDEMRRIICEEEPPKPSTRLSTLRAEKETVNDQRWADARRMSQMLRGELDWIVIKALDKNRGRRYQTAKDFADDVQRYLGGEPVEACPPSMAYRASKLLRKHRGIAAAVGVVGLLLIAGTVIATTLAVRATQAERNAESAQEAAELEAAMANGISDFFRKELLGQASPYENPNRDLRLREVLDRASERIDGHFDGPPLVKAEIRVTLATTYHHLAEFKESARHFDRAYEICAAELGKQHPRTLRIASQRAFYARKTSGAKASAAALEETLKLQQTGLPPEHPDTLRTMARLAMHYTSVSRFAKAQPLFEQAIPAMESALGREHPDTLNCLDSLARMHAYLQRYDESEQLHKQILESRRNVLGEYHPQYHDSLAALAELKMLTGQTEEALDIYDRVVELRHRVQGESHPSTLADQRAATAAFQQARRLEAAEQRCFESLTWHRQRFGEDDRRTRYMMELLATLYEAQGCHNESLPLRQANVDWQRQFGSNNPSSIAAMGKLRDVYRRLDRFDEVDRMNEELARATAQFYGEDAPRALAALVRLAYGYRSTGRFEEAVQILQDVNNRRQQAPGGDDPKTLDYALQLGRVYQDWGKHVEAERQFRKAWSVGLRMGESVHRKTVSAGRDLAKSLRLQNRLVDAEELCREVLEVERQVERVSAGSLLELATLCSLQDRLEEASELMDEAVDICRQAQGRHPLLWETIEHFGDLASHYERRNDPQSARSIRERASGYRLDVLESHRERYGNEHRYTLDAIRRVANSFAKRRQFAEAQKLLRELVETRTRLYGPDDQRTLDAANGLSSCLSKSGQFDEAEQIQQNNLERQVQLSGRQHAKTLEQLMGLAFILKRCGKLAEAETLFRELWSVSPDVLGAEDAETLRAGNQLATVLRLQNRLEEAEPLCREISATRMRVFGEKNLDTLYSLTDLAELCVEAERLDEARELLNRVIRIQRSFLGDAHPDTLDSIGRLNKLPFLYRQRNDLESVVATRATVVELYAEVSGERALRTKNTLGLLVTDYQRVGNWQKMYDASSRLIELRSDRDRQAPPPYHAIMLNTEALKELGRLVEAEEQIREYISQWEAASPEHYKPFGSRIAGTTALHGALADVLVARLKFQEAESVLLKCHDSLSSAGTPSRRIHRQLIRRLVSLYESWNEESQAAHWRRQLSAVD